MRFPTLVWLLAALSLCCCLTTGPQVASASPVSARAVTQLSPTAVRPQRRAVSRAICSQANFQTTFTVSTKVPITGLIVNVPLTASFNNFCLCATTDGLTPATITAINTELDAKLTTLLAGLLNPLAVAPNVPALRVSTQAAALAALELKTPTCNYPAFAIPSSCTSCDAFSCKTDYQRCNGLCVPLGQPCTSPGARKRSLATRSKYICPLDEAPCPVVRGTTKVDAVLDLKNVECVAVRHKLESCGGCLTPFPGGPQGQDCSQLPNAWDVACVAGSCVVEACAPGFVPTSDRTACERVRPGTVANRQCLPGHCKRSEVPIVARRPAHNEAAWQAVSAAAATSVPGAVVVVVSAGSG